LNKIKRRTGLVIATTLLLLAGCAPITLAPTQPLPEAIYTDAARTMAAELTLAAGSTAVARLTEIASPPQPTIPLPTISLPTAVPPPTEAPRPTFLPSPSATPTESLPCDAASYEGDASYQNYTSRLPGERFVQSWRIRNEGSCTWTPAYSLAFAGGDTLGGATLVSLPAAVPPGGHVEVGIEMTAPSAAGRYQGYWVLRTPANFTVEVVPAPLGALWAQIEVQSLPPVRGEYDFASSYCTALWLSNVQALGCPGFNDSTSGSVIVLQDPHLESRKENEPALWLRPGEGRNGWISGEYPEWLVRPGDRFISEVGCLDDNPDCDLVFELDYRERDGDIENLDRWHETYDGETTYIEIDLSDLEGETVRFILSVTNQGRHSEAQGFWLVPRIENFSNREELVISWRKEGGEQDVCADVKVYLTGRRTGEARARTCEGNLRESGRLTLDENEMEQVLKWIDRYGSYEFEAQTPSGDETLVEKISFKGDGSREALINTITAMQEFMESLYNSIIF